MNERAPLLEVDDLAIDFVTDEGRVHAVDGVEFDVAKGERVALVGESGSGKTATALALVRLLPEPAGTIVHGRVRFEGEEILRAPEQRLEQIRGGRVGFVFQEPLTALNPVYTVGFQIAEAVRLHRRASRGEARRRALDLLKRVGFPDAEQALERYPHELSGGMRQRVVIAIAVANDPALLVADEPTTALDVTVQAQVLELFRDLSRERSMSLLLVAHDLAVVSEVTDKVVVMVSGVVVERGPTRDVLSSPAHPYTRALLASAPKMGSYRVRGQRRPPLPVLEGAAPDMRAPPEGCRFQGRCPQVFDRCKNDPVPLYPRPDGSGDVRCFLHDPAAAREEAS